MRYSKVLFFCAVFATTSAMAQTSTTSAAAPASAPDKDRATNLQQVTVSGVQPGPGLWKISKGDHVLWVLGTLTPLPKNMQWEAREVQDDLARAQQVLDAPTIDVDADIGFFGKLALLPSLIGVRSNPGGRKLQDLMPATEYARWLALKKKYIGHDNGVEKQRPIFAAITLYFAAIKQAQLADKVIDPVIGKELKQRGMKATPVAFTIQVKNPRELVKDFKHESIGDLDCFSKTLDHLESDVGMMRERANAWSTGDLDHLRALPMSNEMDVCVSAITESGIAQKLGVADLRKKLAATWVSAASQALDANRFTFASLPIANLLGPNSYLSTMRSRGYRVDLPDGLSDESGSPEK
ncbi:TraB/GumN family protein [Rhodanobacter sp. L36]|uniref:TraB/GumN family protein n=1 Tax=Rhodanobacter sp. L36 TaxID=1747221 RepID=UPI00131D6463|nr:TraB/GumN family protein [Rhodanobacter sp. L36]